MIEAEFKEPLWLKEQSERYETSSTKKDSLTRESPSDFFVNRSNASLRIIGDKGRLLALVLYITKFEKLYSSGADLLRGLLTKHPENKWLHKRKGSRTSSHTAAKDYAFYEYVICGGEPLGSLFVPRVPEIEDILLTEIAELGFSGFSADDVKDEFRLGLNLPHKTLSAAVMALDEAAENIRSNSAPMCHIDVSLAGVIYEEVSGSLDNETKAHLEGVVSYMSSSGDSDIVCLSGSAFSGRTSLLRTAFARLGTTLDGGSRGIIVKSDDETQIIQRKPICALNCHRKTYSEIVAWVGQFLHIPTEPNEHALSLDDQLKKLRIYARRINAVYVFTNLNLSSDASERQIRGEGMMRLLRILSGAGSGNRIIVTNATEMSAAIDQSPTRVRNYVIKDRQFKDLKKFFQSESDIAKWVDAACNEHFDQMEDTVSGALLSFLTSAIRVIATPTETNFESSTPETKVMRLVLRMSDFLRADKSTADSIDEAEIEFCAGVWDDIKPRIYAMNSHLEWVLPLIAASDDGLSRASLTTVFLEHENIHTVELNESFEALLTALDELGAVTGNRLLFRSVASVVDSLEMTPEDLLQTVPVEKLWSGIPDSQNSTAEVTHSIPAYRLIYTIDSRPSTGLLRAVRKEDERLKSLADQDADNSKSKSPSASRNMYSDTYRRLARLARERSSLIKLQMEGIYGQRKSDLRRDLLAYVALLASLNQDSIIEDAHSDNLSLLAVSEIEVFADTEDSSKNGLKDIERLRFAYHALFERDIDRDYRLTMRLDEDGLRLNLLLQLFFGVGIRKRGMKIEAAKLGPTFPAHLLAAFDKSTLADIVTSIAVSAFYADNPKRLFEAVDLGRHLFSTLSKDPDDQIETGVLLPTTKIKQKLFRLWEAELDGLFQGYVRPGERSINSWSILEQRIAELERDYSCGGDVSSFTQTALQNLSLQSLRLAHARGNIEQNRKTSVDIHIRDALSIYKNRRVQDFGLSGRLARRMIKILLGDVGVFAGEKLASVDHVQSARNLLRLNIGRLSHFNGGDRVGVLIDCALVSASQGKSYDSIRFSQDAWDEITFSSISRSLHADRLWHHAVCLVSAIQKPAYELKSSEKISLTVALSELDELIELSDKTFIHYAVLAQTLRRQLFLEYDQEFTEADEDAWRLTKAQAIRLNAPRLVEVHRRLDTQLPSQ